MLAYKPRSQTPCKNKERHEHRRSAYEARDSPKIDLASSDDGSLAFTTPNCLHRQVQSDGARAARCVYWDGRATEVKMVRDLVRNHARNTRQRAPCLHFILQEIVSMQRGHGSY